MELLNFSAEERTLLQEYLAGLEGRRRGACLPSQVQVIKTNTFATDCEALFAYYPPLGLETLAVRPVFNPDGRHRILVNGELCQGLSLAYNLAQALYQLDDLARYAAEHGNLYRFDQQEALAKYYHEFLLWCLFHAAANASLLQVLWSGRGQQDHSSPSNSYQVQVANFQAEEMLAGLEALRDSADMHSWRLALWAFLHGWASYCGRLCFAGQPVALVEMDPQLPLAVLEQCFGIPCCQALLGALARAFTYEQWRSAELGPAIRRAVLALEAAGAERRRLHS